MPNKENSIAVECRHFKWRIRLRKNGIWQADSRGKNSLRGRRHSLGTRDLEEAKRNVHLLDEKMAAEQGLISYQALFNRKDFTLALDAGFAAFQEHIERPRAAGGPKKSTSKRYGRVLRAFRSFLDGKRIQFFEQISKQVLDEYAIHRSASCEDSSIKLELITIRSLLNFLRDEKLLPIESHFRYQTKKFRKTKRRYCPLVEEASAILRVLQKDENLTWLFNAVIVLLNTGLRLSEIAQITRHDVNIQLGVIWVLDEEDDAQSEKTTKSGESRFLPITSELLPVLASLVHSSRERLFEGPRGGRLRSDTLNDNLRSQVLSKLEDRFPNPRFQTITAHCLRHFFRTHATYCGISITEIDAWMGHSASTMSQHYFHADMKSARQSIKKFKPLMGGHSNSEIDSETENHF